MPPPSPPKPPPPSPPKTQSPGCNGTVQPQAVRPMQRSRCATIDAHKIIIYGPGALARARLAAITWINPLFIDIEDSRPFLDVARIDPAPETWTSCGQCFTTSLRSSNFGPW